MLVMIHSIVYILVIMTEKIPSKDNTYAACLRNWTEFGNKCFYFSAYSSNWRSSQASCMTQNAQLGQFDNLGELVRNGQVSVYLFVLLNNILP